LCWIPDLLPLRSSRPGKGERAWLRWRLPLRRRLYRPALAAARFDPDLKATYAQPLEAGKPAQVAHADIVRKLVVLADALLETGRTWSPKPARSTRIL
jgi:transposase